jgi:DNA segregation ATPase FtsK/SpoIIIE-like protein
MMVQHGATNIDDLKQMGVRLHKVCIFIDEFAQLTLNTTKLGKQSIGKISENYLTRIAALGRSAGFRIIVSTQMVNSAVVSSLIRANFENRVAFSTSDWRQSHLIVESSEADGLPRGRAILRIRGKTTMVQTPFVTSRQVKIEVERVAQFGPDGAWGEELEKQRFVKDAKLLVDMACKYHDGNMHRNKILALSEVRGVVGFDRFLEVTQRLERDGVLEPAHANKPRRVNRVFYNRLVLIDNLYGTEPSTADPTADDDIPVLWENETLVEARPNEEINDDAHDTAAVTCGRESDMITTNAKRMDDASAQTPIQARMA